MFGRELGHHRLCYIVAPTCHEGHCFYRCVQPKDNSCGNWHWCSMCATPHGSILAYFWIVDPFSRFLPAVWLPFQCSFCPMSQFLNNNKVLLVLSSRKLYPNLFLPSRLIARDSTFPFSTTLIKHDTQLSVPLKIITSEKHLCLEMPLIEFFWPAL